MYKYISTSIRKIQEWTKGIHVQASEGRCVLEGVGGSKGADRAGWLE